MSPTACFVCGDTILFLSEECAVASIIFQMEHGIKVSDMIFKRREIVVPAYTLYELTIKVMVHSDQITARAELYELPISIFHSYSFIIISFAEFKAATLCNKLYFNCYKMSTLIVRFLHSFVK